MASAATRGGTVGSPGTVAGALTASVAAAAAAAVVGDVSRASPAAAGAAGGAGAVGAAAGSPMVNEKLVQLKKEKRVLHVMLKNFEKEFKEKNGREVGIFSFIVDLGHQQQPLPIRRSNHCTLKGVIFGWMVRCLQR